MFRDARRRLKNILPVITVLFLVNPFGTNTTDQVGVAHAKSTSGTLYNRLSPVAFGEQGGIDGGVHDAGNAGRHAGGLLSEQAPAESGLAGAFPMTREYGIIANRAASSLWEPWGITNARLYDRFEIAKNASRCSFADGGRKTANAFWLEGYYRGGHVSGDADSDGYTENRGGFMLGIDRKLTTFADFGIAFGYGNPRLSNGPNRTAANDFTAALYSNVRLSGKVYANLYIGYGNQKYDDAGFSDPADRSSAWGGESLHASAEFFRPFRHKNAILFPLVAIDYQKASTDAVDCSPTLRIHDGFLEKTTVRVGMNSRLRLDDRFYLRTRLQYGIQVGGETQGSVAVSFTSKTQNDGVLKGVNLGKHKLYLGIGGEYLLGPNRKTRLFLDYDFERGQKKGTHTGRMGISTKW